MDLNIFLERAEVIAIFDVMPMCYSFTGENESDGKDDTCKQTKGISGSNSIDTVCLYDFCCCVACGGSWHGIG